MVDPFDFPDPGSIKDESIYTNRLSRFHYTKKGIAMKQLSKDAQPLTSARPRLSGYAKAGEFTPLEAVEGQELLIHSIDPIETKFGAAYKLGCSVEATGEVHVICAGQMVVKSAIDAFLAEAAELGSEPQLPIAVRFVKPGKAWLME